MNAVILDVFMWILKVQNDTLRALTLSIDGLNWNVPIGTFQLEHTVSIHAYTSKACHYTHKHNPHIYM